MAAAVVEAEERITQVRMEGLALLKIVKHCHESLPQMVTGSLLGFTSSNGVLDITHAFPFPETSSSSKDDENNIILDTGGGSDYQLEMMRMLREVNVDNNCIGWYQSMYLGIYSTSSLVENQLSYQTDLSPNAVVILYDPMQTSHGKLVLKCYRLSDECLEWKTKKNNTFLHPSKLFQELPVHLINPGLTQVFLTTQLPSSKTDITFDRLDLSTHPYLEKHLEFLSTWVEDLSAEQHKFQQYSRTRNAKDAARRKKDEGWSSQDAPRRLESLLITNQIRTYCDQMDRFAGGGLGKLFLAGGLHQEKRASTTANTTTTTTK